MTSDKDVSARTIEDLIISGALTFFFYFRAEAIII